MELWQINWPKFNSTYCGVYVIAPSSNGPSKIGVSQNVVARIAGMQADNWLELKVYDYSYCGSTDEALMVEAKAHEQAKGDGRSLRGEWFDLPPEKAAEIVAFAANMLGIEMRRDKPRTLIKPPKPVRMTGFLRPSRWDKCRGPGNPCDQN